MVDAKPLDFVFGDQPAHERVHLLERLAVLDAKPGERIDVEEAAIVDFAAGKPPMREAIVLALQQVMQRKRCAGPF